MWIDAFEVESVLSQRHTKKNSTIKLFDWKKDAGRLRKNRYAALIAAQASMTSPSLDTLYGQCASALKANGKFFAADLMWASPDGRPASQPQDGKAPAWHSLRSVDEHKAAIAASGLSIETSYDLTDGLLAAIRSGLAGSIDSLSELRSLGEPRKSQRRSAFSAELETWGSYYFLGQKRAIRAMGLLAVKRNAAAVRK